MKRIRKPKIKKIKTKGVRKVTLVKRPTLKFKRR